MNHSNNVITIKKLLRDKQTSSNAFKTQQQNRTMTLITKTQLTIKRITLNARHIPLYIKLHTQNAPTQLNTLTKP